MTVSNIDKSDALLISTRDGTYPHSEDVLKATLDDTALESSLQRVNEAKKQIETDIQGLSRKGSSDVDEWITRARRVQGDIDRSKIIAREIVRDYEALQNSSASVQDARAKLELLQNETSFNHAITLSLENTLQVDRDLNEGEATLAAGKLMELSAYIEQLSSVTHRLTDSNAKQINLDRLSRLQSTLVEGLTAALVAMIVFDRGASGRQVLVNHGQHEGLHIPLERLLETLEKVESSEAFFRNISRTFHRQICQPVLSNSPAAVLCSIDESSHRLTLSYTDNKKDASNVVDCLSSVFRFLHNHVSSRLGAAIGNTLSEELTGALVRDWLTPAIPLGLSDLRDFYRTQMKVEELVHLMLSYHWPGHKALTIWVDKVPHLWLEKRRTSSLDAVRIAMKAQRGPNREVQRTERQRVSKEDTAFVENVVDDWNASWTDEESETTAAPANLVNKEEEDMSGWDFEEETGNSSSAQPSSSKADGDVEDSADAWGWDENNADETGLNDTRPPTDKANMESTNGSAQRREITLTETYTITAIPDHLLDIISKEVRDAEQIKVGGYASFENISASAGLLSLPTMLLAMFRAIAPAYYSTTISDGNMHLYNDGVYVVEKLRDLADSTSLPQLAQDCDVLEKFARTAYAREMDLQRTVLRDLLDGAQGFVNCTRFPYSAESENAVSSTIARLRSIHHDWMSILSRSALLQSIGSLLSTVIEKVVKDVEDMEDISEAESQRLTAFCSQISALEDLFLSERLVPAEGADAEAVPLTAVYVSSWLRFQYLSNILESSLVDIKYLWTEGELSLEFTADEVIELIDALFAESSHRRNAIAEIRRSRP